MYPKEPQFFVRLILNFGFDNIAPYRWKRMITLTSDDWYGDLATQQCFNLAKTFPRGISRLDKL